VIDIAAIALDTAVVFDFDIVADLASGFETAADDTADHVQCIAPMFVHYS